MNKLNQQQKKNFSGYIFSYALLSLLFIMGFMSSCQNDDNNFGNLKVHLNVKSNAQISISDIPIHLTNTMNGINITQKSDQSGETTFKDLPEGIYNLKVDTTKDQIYIVGQQNDINIVANQMPTVDLNLSLSTPSTKNLVIKELYYNGSNDQSYAVMFKDQFIEIFNNSDHTIYADGLYIANLYGDTGANASNVVSKQFNIQDNVYADWVAQIPGNGKDYPVESGKSIVIAYNAINFKKEVNPETNGNPDNEIDLSTANFELYAYPWTSEHRSNTDTDPFDLDNPDVTNMKTIFIMDNLTSCLWDLTGTSAVIFRTEVDPENWEITTFHGMLVNDPISVNLVKIPTKNIIDGVDMLNNNKPGITMFKRLPKSVDRGYHYLIDQGDGSLTGKSVRRIKDVNASNKLGRTVLKDTNNSTVDFEVKNRPTPFSYNN